MTMRKRVHKFRIFHKKEEKYITLKEYSKLGAICIENDGSMSFSSAYLFVINMMIIPEAFIIEQYSEKKDKDGEELYDGDIFEALHDFGPGGWHLRKGTVGFDPETGYQWQYWKDIKKLGNINENPELLEKGE